MTATQVFFRFIKSEYTKNDGTVNMEIYNFWRKEMRRNYIICHYEYSFGKIKVKRKSENFVDDYLSKGGYTLLGFAGHYFDNSPGLHRYNSLMLNLKQRRSKLIKRWREFVLNHIEGNIKSRYSFVKQYNYSWKE